MKQAKTILTSFEGSLGTITLNRPDLHHAMNLLMIREISKAISVFSDEPGVRIILIKSTGKHFCAGADLNWMREGQKQSAEALKLESMELARLFKTIRETRNIVITAVQGKVIGGANGLVAASDLVIAESTANFSFSEVKLGLVPATIAPFVVARVGRRRAAALMLSGRSFNVMEAKTAGMVDISCEEGKLESETDTAIKEMLTGGPEAMIGIKQMLQSFNFSRDPEKILEESAEILAKFRTSPEGQEGMNAFLEKRRPSWNEKL